MSARWLWVRLYNLPHDSPLAVEVNHLDADKAESAPVEMSERGRIAAPKSLYDVPLAGSFAEVSAFVNGADLN